MRALISRHGLLFPKRRDELTVREAESSTPELPVFELSLPDGKRMRTDARTKAIVLLFSGYRHLGEVAARAQEQFPDVTEEDVWIVLDEQLSFGAVILNQDRMLPQASAPEHFDVTPGARFEFGLCSDSCRRFHAGPVTAPYADWLSENPVIRALPAYAERELFEPLPSDERYRQVRHEEGACIFLSGSHCVIERELGVAAQPQPCRGYPFQLMRTPRGSFYSLEPVDRRVFRSSATGIELSSDEGQLELRLRLHDFPGRRFRRDEVLLLPNYRVLFPVYLRLEEKILSELGRNPRQSALEFLRRVITAVVWLPSIAPQLTNIIEAVHDLRFDDVRLQGPFWEGFWHTFTPALHQLTGCLETMAEAAQTTDFARAEILELLAATLALREIWESEGYEPLRKMTVEPECNAIFHLALEHFLYGKAFLLFPNLASALTAVLFGFFVVRTGSDQRADDGGTAFRSEEDFARLSSAWYAVMREEPLREILTPRDELDRFFDQL
ncbi:MAG: hypothetical protein KC609_15130 [Myxococcales bacterium]|nr:hypothetical protein [Myxococcales bacterium]